MQRQCDAVDVERSGGNTGLFVLHSTVYNALLYCSISVSRESPRRPLFSRSLVGWRHLLIRLRLDDFCTLVKRKGKYVPFDPTVFSVENVLLFAIVLDQQAGRSQVMTRESRKEMMCHLQVQSAVHKLDLW